MDERRERIALEATYQISAICDMMLRIPDNSDALSAYRTLAVRTGQLNGELIWLLGDDGVDLDRAEEVVFGVRQTPPANDDVDEGADAD